VSARELDPLREHAMRTPEAPALRCGETIFTYAVLDAYAQRLKQQFGDAGIGDGVRVGVMMAASAASVATLFALLRLKAVAVCLNVRNPDDVLVAQLRALDAERVIVDVENQRELHGATLLTCSPDVDDGLESAASLTPISIDEDQPATAVYTSGSSAAPKAALHSVGNHLAAARASNAYNGLGPGDVWLLSLPCFHVAGLGIVFRCMTAGATIAISDRENVLAALSHEHVTHLSLVPAQLLRLLDDLVEAPQPLSLKSVLVGGAACAPSLMQRAVDAGLPACRTYGMTEMTSQIATAASPNSGARALAGVEVRLSGDGEIEVRGPSLFLGYMTPRGLQRPLTADGWFRTGDMGEISTSGDLRVIGRVDNMFVSGGENIQPEEVERVLCSVPGVRRAVVVPIADPEFGQRPCAFIQGDDEAFDSTQLAAALEALLPRYKHPVHYLGWPDARGSDDSLKIDRKGMRHRATAALKTR
jgi:O-succinylbenzoic acid--CoA ligase